MKRILLAFFIAGIQQIYSQTNLKLERIFNIELNAEYKSFQIPDGKAWALQSISYACSVSAGGMCVGHLYSKVNDAEYNIMPAGSNPIWFTANNSIALKIANSPACVTTSGMLTVFEYAIPTKQ